MKKNSITTTKRCLVTVIAVGLAASMLAGCGKSGTFEVDGLDTIVTFNVDKKTSDISIDIENPWVNTDKEGVLEATGLNMYTPAEATNAKYSYLKTSNIAQVTFNYNGHDNWTYRKQKADMIMDISGLYYEWIQQDITEVSGKEAIEYAYVEGNDDSGMIDDMYGVQLINWYDDSTGTTYSLSVSGKDLNGMDLKVIAENLYALENEESNSNPSYLAASE